MTVPYSDNPSSLNTPDDSNTASYRNDDGLADSFNDGYAVSGSTGFPSSTNPFTDVGAYAAISLYGIYDQNGNV